MQDDKDDDSLSSSLSDNDLKDLAAKTGLPTTLLEDVKAKTNLEGKDAPTSIPFVGIGEKKPEIEFKPYTFDPRSLREPPPESNPDPGLMTDPLEALGGLGPPNAISQPRAEPPRLKADFGERDPYPAHGSTGSHSPYGRYESSANSYASKTAGYGSGPSYPPMAPATAAAVALNEDPAVARGTQDYKDFAKDFEREFGKDKMSQKEVESMTKRVEGRYKSLQAFVQELERGDVDMLLFRNKLIRELSDVQNDLREANSNVLVLMNDRANMKDTFCLLQVKVKKLKSMNKTLQEDITKYPSPSPA